MIPFHLPSPLLIAAAITTIITIRFLVKYFIKPFYLLQRYKKYKGVLCLYKPLGGTLLEIKDGEAKYGDSAYYLKKRIKDHPSTRFIAMPLLDRMTIVLFDSDLIKQFLAKETMMTVKYLGLSGGIMSEFLKNGLVFTEGEHWKRQRKLISQVFHFDYMNNSLPTIRATAKEWIEKNCNSSSSSSSPCTVNVSKELKLFTSTVIWRIFFGEDSFDENKTGAPTVLRVLENLRVSTQLTLSVLNLLFGGRFFKLGLREIDRRFMRERKLIKELFYNKLSHLREKINKKSDDDTSADGSKPKFKNLIELLLEQSEGLSDLEIVSQIFTFFFAGTDTTSELLAISHYLLATNPEVQTKLREEVLAHIRKTEDIMYEHITKMEYLNAVIKEALRVGGPVLNIIFREATQDFMLNDIEIKKGMLVTASVAGVAHNPKYFSNPEKFRPERWIEKQDPGTIDTSIYLPFSAGARRCIGEQLVLIEYKVMLCELVRRFKIELKLPFKLTMGIGVVYRAKPDIHVIYTPIS